MINYKIIKNISPSPMERKIVRIFKKENIYYAREVEFDGLVNPTTNKQLRCDFYLPKHNIILEYDGKGYHDSEEVKARDLVKDNFALANGIRLFRVTGGEDLGRFFVDHLGMDANKYEVRRHSIYSIDNQEMNDVSHWVELSKVDPELFYTAIVNLRKSKGHKMYNLLRRHIKAIYNCANKKHLIQDKELIIATLKAAN